MNRSSAGLILLLIVLLGTARQVESADPEPEFIAARQTFLKEMKKKSPATRIEAVQTFARFPIASSAESLLKRGLSDQDITVRDATRAVLREKGKKPDATKTLIEEFKRYIKKPDHEEVLSGLLGAMIVTTDENQQSEVLKTLDDYLGSPKGNLIVPISLIDDLGRQGTAESMNELKFLARAKAFDTQFGYRRSIVQAATHSRETASIGFLVESLPGSQGLIQADIVQHLTRATKQKFKDDDRNWTRWWAENKSTFKVPAALDPVDETADLNQTTYYGIPICAKRIVFVLDTSGSMRGQPMESAKLALLKTLESLPESVSFDIVMFDKTAESWQPRLVPATLSLKNLAAQTVMARGMNIGTASHAALNAAFNLQPEAIYFLSDGEPTDGLPSQIVQAMTERNRTRRISIHTIGVVTQRGGGAGLALFMKPLAELNFGSFRLIE